MLNRNKQESQGHEEARRKAKMRQTGGGDMLYRPTVRQESAQSLQPVVLIGHTGTGKSSVGLELARLLGWPFLDSDQVVTDRHGDIPTLFTEHGEEAFRTYETDVITSIVQSTRPPYVLSVGGGAVLREENRRHLNGLTVVSLTADPATVLPRLLKNPDRPLLRGDVAEQWMRLHEQRRAIYSSMANVTLDVNAGTPASLARKLLPVVTTRTDR